MVNCGFELLPHPPYPPNAALSDYHLFHIFPNMKKQLHGRIFADSEEIMAAVPNVMDGFETHFFEENPKDLAKRCEKFVHLNDHYVEK